MSFLDCYLRFLECFFGEAGTFHPGTDLFEGKISRLVDWSSANGEKPQSSGCPQLRYECVFDSLQDEIADFIGRLYPQFEHIDDAQKDALTRPHARLG